MPSPAAVGDRTVILPNDDATPNTEGQVQPLAATPPQTKQRTEEPRPAADGCGPLYPTPPTSWSVVIAGDGPDLVQTWTFEVVDYVTYNWAFYLQNPPHGPQAKPMSGTRAQQQAIDIQTMGAGDALMSLCEACKHSNAVKAVQLLAMHEGTDNLRVRRESPE